MSMIEGIFETHLEVKNLKESMEFYEKLGLNLGLFEEGRRRAFYTMGKEALSMISIVERENPNLRHMAFRIDINNLMNMISFLKERNITILPGWEGASIEEPMVYPWLGSASVFFNDYDGNRLEFLAVLPEGPRNDIDQIFLSLSEWEKLHRIS
ncbi:MULTISPECIES: VOC family protein [unclassified Bacillus (in: firmicutes)]|uniref:VOC family protein n=1 Tax=unclassified Bacillus (in: firmicutes) TaxID=185979 RepID=UPI0008E8846E|nr:MULTISPECIES: VOC family protein [unclassified Bacillus (in: firmicutes)]SFB13588.1 Glyoxalase/Bleomycin resistance protein/Dioxygenase superfamily protein [Bacillus sp. UNCCL13]SFQ89982.1 Glyoxalase/Bleomycin resistance protein/Dioxygenase superfamily protein [Bacillus sp. cl95]